METVSGYGARSGLGSRSGGQVGKGVGLIHRRCVGSNPTRSTNQQGEIGEVVDRLEGRYAKFGQAVQPLGPRSVPDSESNL